MIREDTASGNVHAYGSLRLRVNRRLDQPHFTQKLYDAKRQGH